jgi:hypothetical protein
MDEGGWLEDFLTCLDSQTFKNFTLVVCVNQPDHWWHDPGKISICIRNKHSLSLLAKRNPTGTVVIDRSSPGKGWTGKKHGVGYARKAAIDFILDAANTEDLIVSLDADTRFSPAYLESIARNFSGDPTKVALAVPYYHNLTGDERTDRAVLRYEIYMRHYFLSLARIGSPYAFTALGSAMAIPVRACRAIGGITPKLSGEDFYFLQKLRKYGKVGWWNDELVYPAARFSDRVFFGTGPAMIRGDQGDWTSYPIYPRQLFSDLEDCYSKIETWYRETNSSPVISFLSEIFNEPDPFLPLRQNHRDLGHFERAFHEKLDGLRILQYLKTHHQPEPGSDEANLSEFVESWHPEIDPLLKDEIIKKPWSFDTTAVSLLSRIRDFLFEKEMAFRATAKPG